MTYQTEFPDYTDALPALPAGFVDTSWHNDSCPSFTHDGLKLRIAIDYVDAAKREMGDGPRFYVTEEGHDYTPDDLLATDDWREVEALVLARHFVAVITEWTTPAELAEIRKRNKTYGRGICATHDFCDANMAMAEAFERAFNRPFLPEAWNKEPTDADVTLWNAAWDRAKLESLS
jgi:hypothetical protein